MSSARESPAAHRTPETTSTKVKTSAGTRDQHLAGHAGLRAGRPCERTRPGCDRAANTPLDCTQDRGWDFRFWRAKVGQRIEAATAPPRGGSRATSDVLHRDPAVTMGSAQPTELAWDNNHCVPAASLRQHTKTESVVRAIANAGRRLDAVAPETPEGERVKSEASGGRRSCALPGCCARRDCAGLSARDTPAISAGPSQRGKISV